MTVASWVHLYVVLNQSNVTGVSRRVKSLPSPPPHGPKWMPKGKKSGAQDSAGVLVVEYIKAPEDDPLCILPNKSCVRPAKVASMKISEILYLLENKK